MKIVIVAPADEARRFRRELPPKGSEFLRRPNYDILRLAACILPPDEVLYIDERVQELDLDQNCDLVLIYADYDLESRSVELAHGFQRRSRPVAVFGPMANFLPQTLSHKIDTVVVGDINNSWSIIRSDADNRKLKRFYTADRTPRYIVPHWELGRNGSFNKRFQALQAIVGCFCPKAVKYLCTQYLYYGGNIQTRRLPEVVGEIIELPFKQVFLLDDDVSYNPDYYFRLFSQAWSFRKEWFIQAGPTIFNYPELLKLLPKAGVRVIFLNEDWFTNDDIYRSCHNRNFFLHKHRQVQLLHSLRMVVGAKILLRRKAGPVDFRGITKCFNRLGIDILELKVFAPVSEKPKFSSIGDRFSSSELLFWPEVFPPTQFPTGFLWLKDQFYSINSVLGRALRALTKIGIYNTFRYFFLTNIAYRQNFLEGISYPP